MFGEQHYYRPVPLVPTGWRRNSVIGITATVLMTGGLLLAAATTDSAHAATVGTTPKQYKNCAALNKDYPHGVGRKNAVDHVSGSSRPVTNFHKNNALYAANKKSDRDGDKIACEKR
ncbi:MAG TPA: excalibur calcium-binding domain-containing protein [Sporichthya sp.]|nr:excalibur calcium-binding domain-containing protein [Sporichthya sp.]